MATVKVRKNEDINKAMRRFKRKIEAEGIMRELKRRRFFVKPSAAKKIKRKNAEKRRRKAEKRKIVRRQ